MSYEMIAILLKSGGFLLIKTFDPKDTNGEKNLKKVEFRPITLTNIKRFFTQQNGYGSHYYIKKEQAGKKNKKQKTKNKRTKNKIKIRNIKRIRAMKTIKRRS